MPPHEKRIHLDRSECLEKGTKAMERALRNVPNPYESDKHADAVKYLADNNIELKPLTVPKNEITD